MSASHSIIMLPGSWETEESSYKLGQQISRALGEMPIDIARRMRTTGFAANGIKQELADDVIAAITEVDLEAARVPDRRGFWTYPELRIAGRVAFEGEEIDYEAGSYQETVMAGELLFLHVAWFSKQKAEDAPERPTRMSTTRRILYSRDILASDGPSKSESLCLDLHMRTPRMILRMDLKNTRYCFPEEGESTFILARPSQVLAGLSRFVRDRLVFPDLRILTDRLDSPIWDSADLEDQGALRSRGSWYRQLAENDLLDRTMEIMKARTSERDERVEAISSAAAPAETPTIDTISNPYRDQLDAVDRWIKRGLKNRALKEAEKAIAMKPDRHEGFRARAKVHLVMGNQTAADDDMSRADELERA